MTRAEFYSKYGDVLVQFASYYKFTFTYAATLPDGNRLTVGCGGSAEGIYRFDVDAGQQVKVADLLPYCGSVYAAGGTEVEGFYDY